jgi:prepilin-type processing-associated H-X9-DG protein
MEKRSAFTLVEALLVIAIVAVLSTLLFSAIQQAREAANRAACANNLRQIGLACHSYHDNNDVFPPGYTAAANADPTSTRPGWGWAAHLLPYLDQSALSQSIDFCWPIEAPGNAAARLTVVKVFLCRSDPSVPAAFTIVDGAGQPIVDAAPISYAATSGAAELDQIPGPLEGVFYRNSRMRIADITDGTTTTTLIGDRSWNWSMATWAGAVQGSVLHGGPRNPHRNSPDAAYPAPSFCLAQNKRFNDRTDLDGALDDFSSLHPGGINMLFADGTVRFLRDTMDPVVFTAMGTRAGGEVVTEADF